MQESCMSEPKRLKFYLPEDENHSYPLPDWAHAQEYIIVGGYPEERESMSRLLDVYVVSSSMSFLLRLYDNDTHDKLLNRISGITGIEENNVVIADRLQRGWTYPEDYPMTTFVHVHDIRRGGMIRERSRSRSRTRATPATEVDLSPTVPFDPSCTRHSAGRQDSKRIILMVVPTEQREIRSRAACRSENTTHWQCIPRL